MANQPNVPSSGNRSLAALLGVLMTGGAVALLAALGNRGGPSTATSTESKPAPSTSKEKPPKPPEPDIR